jgi:UDP-N-acetyl-D-glucosamine dehydrogenase
MQNFIAGFKRRINQKRTKISVVGLGYVGLPLAVEFAKKGFWVLGIDIDKDRIRHIRQKVSYISDITTKELRRVISSRNFSASNSFEAIRETDAVIICVPTPLKRKYHPDISYIKQAVNSIAKNMKRGSLIILESTTYPGTTEDVILPLLESKGLKCGRDFYLAFSPERIDPGNTRYPVSKIPKIIGGVTKEATELTAALYRNIIDKVIPVSSARLAEAVKLLENTFRLINIGLIDELTMMTHKMNIDIWEVIEAAKTKPFGFMPFYPGPGVGGHCIPKDPLYLYWKARLHGFKSRFIKLASDVITRMPEYVVERLEQILRKKHIEPRKAKVLIIGVTYKKDIKDLRKSPSLDIIDILQKRNIKVSYFDPMIPYLKINHINLKSVDLSAKILGEFHCVVIATDHSNIDYDFLLKKSLAIFDLRNVFKGIKNKKIIKL